MLPRRAFAIPLSANADQLAGAKLRKDGTNTGNEGPKIVDVVAARLEHDDRDREARDVLLEAETLIDGDEDIELLLSRAQELTILEAGPAGLGDGTDLVLRELPPEALGDALIEQQAH